MRFTWKGPSTLSAYPVNTAPEPNVPGPYPSKGNTAPTTVTKLVLAKIPRTSGEGSAYYDPLTKSVTFTTATCTQVSTSLPTVCTKRLSRPLKIWRKRLLSDGAGSKKKVTLNQLEGTSVIVTKQETAHCLHNDISHLRDCKPPICKEKRLVSRGTYNPSYCTTNREYLQKRCKTYDQNQMKGKKLSEYTFTSGECFETPGVTGNCNIITIKPSNRTFQEQGGVSASSRTNRLKYDTVISNVHTSNYATARTTIDVGYTQVKGQNRPKSVGFIRARQDRPKIVYCPSV